MFLAVVGRPHRRLDGTQFNGLLGIWTFVTTKSAQRSSENRAHGQQLVEPMNVDGAAFIAMMKPRFFQRFVKHITTPRGASLFKMDGAKPHVASNAQEDLEV